MLCDIVNLKQVKFFFWCGLISFNRLFHFSMFGVTKLGLHAGPHPTQIRCSLKFKGALKEVK